MGVRTGGEGEGEDATICLSCLKRALAERVPQASYGWRAKKSNQHHRGRQAVDKEEEEEEEEEEVGGEEGREGV